MIEITPDERRALAYVALGTRFGARTPVNFWHALDVVLEALEDRGGPILRVIDDESGDEVWRVADDVYVAVTAVSSSSGWTSP